MHIHLHFSWSPSRTSRARSAARMGVLALLLALLIVLLVGPAPARSKPRSKADKTRPAPGHSTHRKHTGKAGAKLDAMQARFAETDRKIQEHFAAMQEDAMAEARQVENELAEMDNLFGMKVIEAHAQIVD